MNTPARLSLYGLTLVAAFGAAYVAAGVIVPDSAAAPQPTSSESDHGGHQSEPTTTGAALPGLAIAADGYLLSPISAPANVGDAGELRFTITDPNGDAVTEYTTEHERDLHLIVVRVDGSEFHHVHPEIDVDGTWSIPWTWDAAGSYRIFTDFTAADAESGVTLTRTVNVAGDFVPVANDQEVREDRVGEFDVALTGDLRTGDPSTLTLTVTRDGQEVTALEPYLGAFGHLVALRDGDLAYLHVHPEGAVPDAADRSGPTVEFVTQAPTPGTYLLYFDFQVAGDVHSAAFVVTADGGSGEEPATESPSESPSEVPVETGDGHTDDH